MKNESINLLTSPSQRVYFLIALLFIFSFNLFNEYLKYKDFKNEEFLTVNANLINIYSKDEFDVLKLQTDSFSFFTSISKNHKFVKNERLSLVIITQKVNFFNYLKGFYSKSINYEKLEKKMFINILSEKIKSQHSHPDVSELFDALFLAIPLNRNLRDFFASFGISHLIAISGFHLGVLSFCLYFIFNSFYAYFHQKFFPFRNKRFDILLICIVILFFYLILTNIVPSLLRAFIMFCMGFYLLRNNIKVLSFETLLITLLLILSFFPKYIFSLSLWFSICGVFYIFLFLKYFKDLPKVTMFLLFNFWIFASFNPIVHYFFSYTSYEQLTSPIITLLFTLFYPFELFLHFIGWGSLLDEYLILFLNYKVNIFEVWTPLWFFLLYISVSFVSIYRNEAFVVLNVLLIGFNIYLYV